MLDEKNDSLPLFIHGFDPLKVIVVDNTIISIEEDSCYEFSPYTAFEFLYELFRHKSTRKFIPKEFHQLLGKSISKKLYNAYFPCITGRIEFEARMQCLALKMAIDEKEAIVKVKLYDFVLVENVDRAVTDEFDCLNLELELQLSAEEAFFIFANISSSMASFRTLYDTEHNSFDPQYLQVKIEKNYREDSSNPSVTQSEISYFTDSFTVLYFQYLIDQFTKKAITPATILRLSGGSVLAYLADNPTMQAFFQEVFHELQNNFSLLTLNQKIQYYSLLEICHSWVKPIDSEIHSFYKANSNVITSLKKELTTSYPDLRKLKGKKISFLQFIKEYKSYFSK